MPHFTDISGLAGIALAIVAYALRLPVATRMPPRQQAWLAGALLVALAIPFGGLSAAELIRGITGDLSITTLVVVLALRGNGGTANALSHEPLAGAAIGHHEKYSLLAFVTITALALYPFALGVGMFDPYRLGFGNLWLIAGLLLVTLIAWIRHYTLVALSISLAVLAWSLGWYESNNLWDYLLDPWVSIYALSALVKHTVSIAAKRLF